MDDSSEDDDGDGDGNDGGGNRFGGMAAANMLKLRLFIDVAVLYHETAHGAYKGMAGLSTVTRSGMKMKMWFGHIVATERKSDNS